jgi:VanZ family protein
MSSSLAERPMATRPGFGRLVWVWAPVVFCVCVIACESTVYFGADRTTGPLQHLFEFLLHRHFTQPQWWRLHLIIRKCGHFTGYGILSASWFRAFWLTLRGEHRASRFRLGIHALAMLGTLLIAASDETHQLFLPNRTGSIYDVMIDCMGGLIVQALIWLYISLLHSRQGSRL